MHSPILSLHVHTSLCDLPGAVQGCNCLGCTCIWLAGWMLPLRIGKNRVETALVLRAALNWVSFIFVDSRKLLELSKYLNDDTKCLQVWWKINLAETESIKLAGRGRMMTEAVRLISTGNSLKTIWQCKQVFAVCFQLFFHKWDMFIYLLQHAHRSR